MKTQTLPYWTLALTVVAFVGVLLLARHQQSSAAGEGNRMAVAAATDSGPQPTAPSSGGIVWVKSLSAGLKRAAAEKKPVLIDFYTEWCGWCRRLDQETYTDPRVRAKARQFVCVKIDAETDSDTASRYRVDGFPTIVFTDAAAKEIHRVTGFAPPEEFLKEMAKALAAKKPS